MGKYRDIRTNQRSTVTGVLVFGTHKVSMNIFGMRLLDPKTRISQRGEAVHFPITYGALSLSLRPLFQRQTARLGSSRDSLCYTVGAVHELLRVRLLSHQRLCE